MTSTDLARFFQPWTEQGGHLDFGVAWEQILPKEARLEFPFSSPIFAVLSFDGGYYWAVDDLRGLPDVEAIARALVLKQQMVQVGFFATPVQRRRLNRWCQLGSHVKWWHPEEAVEALKAPASLPLQRAEIPMPVPKAENVPIKMPLTAAVAPTSLDIGKGRELLDRLRAMLEQTIPLGEKTAAEAEISAAIDEYQTLETEFRAKHMDGVLTRGGEALIRVQALLSRLNQAKPSTAPPLSMSRTPEADVSGKGDESGLLDVVSEATEMEDLARNLEEALCRQVEILERATQSPLQGAAGDILEEFRHELNELVALYEGQKVDEALYRLSDLESKGSMINRILGQYVKTT